MSEHSKLFRELLRDLERDSVYEKALDEALDKYTIRPFNIEKLSMWRARAQTHTNAKIIDLFLI